MKNWAGNVTYSTSRVLWLGARPHWGKVFISSAQELEAVYPKLPAFRQLRERLDPNGTFRNDLVARYGM